MYSSALAIKNNNEFQPLSAQYFVDCDYYDNGCQGGFQYMAWMFAKEKGFYYQSDYFYKTYQGKKFTCRDGASQNRKYD